MPSVTYVDADGEQRTVEAAPNATVMEVALKHDIPGIVGECGGACACATCHVYVDENFAAETGRASAMEESMLDFAENVEPNSRLSCQIRVSDALDGLNGALYSEAGQRWQGDALWQAIQALPPASSPDLDQEQGALPPLYPR